MRENRNISKTMWNFTAMLYLLLLSTTRSIVWHYNQACEFFEVTSGSSAEILQTLEKSVINTEHAPEQYKNGTN